MSPYLLLVTGAEKGLGYIVRIMVLLKWWVFVIVVVSCLFWQLLGTDPRAFHMLASSATKLYSKPYRSSFKQNPPKNLALNYT